MLSENFPVFHENFVTKSPQTRYPTTIHLSARDITSTSWHRNLDLTRLPGNSTYNLTDISASEVLDNHKSVHISFGIEASGDELDLPYIYWIPKIHKNPYKHRFIAGSSNFSTKPLFILRTKPLTHIKQDLQKYCETTYSRSGINQMWILKNSEGLLRTSYISNFKPCNKY